MGGNQLHDGFGSDGFRGVIGHRYTRHNLHRILRAVDGYLREDAGIEPQDCIIPIGYDTRFLAREAAHFCARTLASLGYAPLVAETPCPSPYLAYCTRKLEAPIGLELTASHNPALYGGLKLKGSHGGSLLPADVGVLRERMAALEPEQTVEPLVGPEHAETFDLREDYGVAVLDAADSSGDPEQYITVDYMHGTTANVYRAILDELFHLNQGLREEPDPYFGGRKPEPLPSSLKDLAVRIGYDGHDSIGLAFDGDGDRLAVVDETGSFLASHEIFCILLEHTVKTRGPGTVVGTVSFSDLVRRCAESLGCSYIEVPVGFKTVSEAMLAQQAIIGGEESGGTGFGHYLPERDALLMAICVLEARHQSGATLNAMVDSLYAKYGRRLFVHHDYRTAESWGVEGLAERQAKLEELGQVAGDEVTEVRTVDGCKLITANGWLLVRQSGTEPLIRMYADADSESRVTAYIDAGRTALGLK